MDTGNTNFLYEAFKAKDERLDGKYFVGVSSTGIYCRPVCSAKMPKKENCSFYESAAEAELNGFRPCIVCRPELAPGKAKVDSSLNILNKATMMIDEGFLDENSLGELAVSLGVSDRHLRRIFKDKLNISPINYVQTSRLLLAKELLTDTNLSVSDVAFASGFKSLRRFNDSFKDNYKMAPNDLRKGRLKKDKNSLDITIKIGYREPFRYDEILKFLEKRAIKGVEKVEDGKYYRTLNIKKNDEYVSGYIIVSNNRKKKVLEVTLHENLLRVLSQVIKCVKDVFDLYSDPYVIYDSLKSFNDIIPDGFKIGTRIVGSVDEFEICVRAIIGQLVSVDMAVKILSDFTYKFGKRIDTGVEGLDYVFPVPLDIYEIKDTYDEICPLHITRTKVDAIVGVASLFVGGNLDFKTCFNTKDEIDKLLSVRGVGKWTAEYIAMRAMRDTDILLDTDYAIRKIFEKENIDDMSIFDRYSPYRSYLTIGLWNLF